MAQVDVGDHRDPSGGFLRSPRVSRRGWVRLGRKQAYLGVGAQRVGRSNLQLTESCPACQGEEQAHSREGSVRNRQAPSASGGVDCENSTATASSRAHRNNAATRARRDCTAATTGGSTTRNSDGGSTTTDWGACASAPRLPQGVGGEAEGGWLYPDRRRTEWTAPLELSVPRCGWVAGRVLRPEGSRFSAEIRRNRFRRGAMRVSADAPRRGHLFCAGLFVYE